MRAGRMASWRSHGWGPMGYTRARTAKENSNPRNYNPQAGYQLVAIQGAVGVLARGVASSKLAIQEKKGGIWETVYTDLPRWADPDKRPNTYQSCYEMLHHFTTGMLVGGNGYLLSLSKRDGLPDHLISVPGGEVSITLGGREVTLETEGGKARGDLKLEYYVEGYKYRPFNALQTDGQMMHGKLITRESLVFGESPLMIGAPTLRTALSAEAHAELFFNSGGIPPAVLMAKGKTGMNQEAANAVKEHYDRIRKDPDNRHRPLMLSGEWGWLNTFVNPEQMQLIDARKFTFSAASALYGVPPPLFGGPDITTWGQGVRQLMRFFVQHSLTPLLNHIGGLLTEMTPEGTRAVLMPDHLLTTEPLENSRYLDRLIAAGIMMRSEARESLGLPPVDGIDDMPLPGGSGPDGGGSDSGRDDGDENNVEDMDQSDDDDGDGEEDD